MTDIDKVSDAAVTTVDDFIGQHGAAAIPALIGACVLWAVDHGGGAVVRGSLSNAIKLSRTAETGRKRGLS